MMAGLRTFLVRLAVGLAIALPLYFLVAALGTKFGLLDWRIGFGLMTFRWGLFVVLGVMGVALLAVGAALLVKPRQGIAAALGALGVPLVALAYAFTAVSGARSVPPIHDISTDLVDPPAFSETVATERARVPGVNSLDLINKRMGRPGEANAPLVTEVQRKSYPDIAPISLAAPPADALNTARAAAEKLGWRIARVDEPGGAFEATVQSFWYGFTDDIVVRVRPGPTAGSSIVDVRSVSRVGMSDLGANAKRIRAFTKQLKSEAPKA